MKQRDYRIDLLRAFACIMVLFCHSPQHYIGQGGKFLVGIDNYFGMAWGPIMFFMISGACIMKSQDDAKTFIKKRLSRVLIPTILWSIVYIFVETCCWKSFPISDALAKIPMILASPQYSLMWFMYALLGIYLVAPIFAKWLASASPKEVLFYLVLWGMTLLFPYIALLGLDCTPLLKTSSVFYYFGGFLWYAVAGYYCYNYVQITKVTFPVVLLCILILISPACALIIKHFTGELLDYSSCILPMLTTVLGFVFLKNITLPHWMEDGLFRRCVESISKLSFGIYLVHMLFMYPFRLWIEQFQLNYAIQLPLTALVVGVFSYCASWCLSKLPFSKYLIG